MALSKEEAKKLLTKRAMNASFELFCNRCKLGINACSPEAKAAGKDDSNTKLPEHCIRWANLLDDNKNVLLLGPREHAKTVTFERYMLWNIARNPNIRIIIVSATANMAEKVLFFIKSNIESNPDFIYYYGDMVGSDKWTNNEILVKRVNKYERNVTVFACGIGGTVVGRRCDLAVVDDPIDAGSLSPTVRKQIEEYVWTELQGCIGSEGRMIFIGSRKGADDLYAYIQKEHGIKVHIEKAILNEKEKKVLWPEKWSYEALCERRRQNAYRFGLNYMNEVLCTEGRLIDPNNVLDSIKSEYYLEYRGSSGGVYVMGVDHSILDTPEEASRKNSDYFAITVLKQIGQASEALEEKWKVAYCHQERGITPEAQIDKVIEVCERFMPQLIYSEATGFQRIYSILLRKKSSFPFQPFQMVQKNKWNTANGIPTMRQSFNKGRFILPTKYKPGEDEDINDVEPDKTMAEFIHQCYMFAPEMSENDKTDLFMSFFMADRAAFDRPLFYSKVWVGAV